MGAARAGYQSSAGLGFVASQQNVRPGGFEPPTCGIERSDLEDEGLSVKDLLRYPLSVRSRTDRSRSLMILKYRL